MNMMERHLSPFASINHLKFITALLPLTVMSYWTHNVIRDQDLSTNRTCLDWILNEGINKGYSFTIKDGSSKLNSSIVARSQSGGLQCIGLLSSPSPSSLSPLPTFHNGNPQYAFSAITIINVVDVSDGRSYSFPYSQFLLFIGPCASSPTDITLSYSSNHNILQVGSYSHQFSAFKDFSIVEDICAEGPSDIGAVLYRLSSNYTTTKA
jgi:hypothetical protein